MIKIRNYIKSKFKLLSFLCLVLLIIFVNLSSVFAEKGYQSENFKDNKQVQQLFKKIEIIKEKFPNQIDEEALYATLVHRGTFTDYVEESYDENFDEDSYSSQMGDFAEQVKNLQGNIYDNIMSIGDLLLSRVECWFEPEDESDGKGSYDDDCVIEKMIEKYVERTNANSENEFVSIEGIKTPQTIDLLMAATVVMLDSSGWIGNYSDENYEKALAGDKLVGNMFDKYSPIQNAMATIMNGVFCAAGSTFDLTVNWFNPGINFGENRLFSVEKNAMAGKLSRFYTMSHICKDGYVGGTYAHVKNPDLSTEKGKEEYQGKKDIVAKEIIDLAKRFRASSGSGSNNCVVNPSSSGAFSTWKQYADEWGSISLGGSSSMKRIGCLITSLSMLIARSGTQITNLPSGFDSFNPGAFVTGLNQSGIAFIGGAFTWNGYQTMVPNLKFNSFVYTNITDTKTLANTLSNELSTPAEGKYQKFILIQIRHASSSQHWLAVDSVTNDNVTVFDPGSGGNTLDDSYNNWVVEGYKVVYATDVLQGAAGNSSSSNNYCETSGDIIIPEEFGNGGYTVTVYDDWNWVYNQGKMYDKWANAGGVFDDGIATYEGRYLIACTETFGKVGDKIDFFLDDGTKIPAIIADIKSSGDAGYNKWGHNNGQNVIEFEVSHLAFYVTYKTNPGTGNWYPEWGGKRVASATNLGENVIN